MAVSLIFLCPWQLGRSPILNLMIKLGSTIRIVRETIVMMEPMGHLNILKAAVSWSSKTQGTRKKISNMPFKFASSAPKKAKVTTTGSKSVSCL